MSEEEKTEMNTVKKMRRRDVRATAVELECANCGRWWVPIRQPPAKHVKTCSDRCRVALHRAGKKALKS